MKAADVPNPPPQTPTSPTVSVCTTPSNRATLEPIKPSPSRNYSSQMQRLHSTRRASRAGSASVSIVEPIREKDWAHTGKKERSVPSKVTHGVGHVLGGVLYVLFFCCVLGGERPPAKSQPLKKVRTSSSTYHGDAAGRPRVRKMSSSEVSSKAGSERVERV